MMLEAVVTESSATSLLVVGVRMRQELKCLEARRMHPKVPGKGALEKSCCIASRLGDAEVMGGRKVTAVVEIGSGEVGDWVGVRHWHLG